MQIIDDTRMKLQITEQQVFVNAWKLRGQPDRGNREWKRYKASGDQEVQTEVVDYCLDVLSERRPHVHPRLIERKTA